MDKEACFHLGVKGVIVNHERNILLLERRASHSGSHWDLPGGRIHRGESQLECLSRELKEEIGLENTYRASHLLVTLPKFRVNEHIGLVLSIYLVEIAESFLPILSDEHVNYTWFTPQIARQHFENSYPQEFLNQLMVIKNEKVIG